MEPVFVDREAELRFLERLYARPGLQVVVLYGRRRVGKSELLNHFASNKKSVSFLCDQRGTQSNAARFAALCASRFDDVAPQASNFDEVFKYLKNRVGNEKFVAIIDEFSYLVEKDGSIPSVFQLAFDEILKGSNFFVVLCGSSVSMMIKGALSYESALYGRRTGDWLLKPMRFFEVRQLYPRAPMEEAMAAYAVFGGIPAYAKHFDGKSVIESINSKVLAKGEFLYDEPQVLLRESLREPSTYYAILEAMAKSTKLTGIANAAGVPAKDMPKYLKTLEELQIVRKMNPVTEKKSKKSAYFIADNFFNFWFKFVYPHKSELEAGSRKETLDGIKRDLNTFLGRAFEKACAEYLEQSKIVPYSKIGKWWGHSRKGGERIAEEIDVVTLDENSKTMLFAECKWKNGVDAQEIARALVEKARNVDWNNGDRREHYAIFAKNFRKKAVECEGKPVHCIELRELYAP